jgi:hypothetical protein
MPADKPTARYTPTQLAALVILMAEARPLANNELRELAGFTLTGPDRTGLVSRGLITSTKVGRGFVHELTDRGWRECADLATGDRPAIQGPAGRALFPLLTGLERALRHHRLSYAEFFDIGDATPDTATEVQVAIRKAYSTLAAQPGAWVGLAELRANVEGYPRSDVDAALRVLARSPGVHLNPEANQQALTAADRAAALRYGGDDNHLISMETA